ncbi:hypothetical protein D3C86_1966110 [compost metagenome]
MPPERSRTPSTNSELIEPGMRTPSRSAAFRPVPASEASVMPSMVLVFSTFCTIGLICGFSAGYCMKRKVSFAASVRCALAFVFSRAALLLAIKAYSALA